MEQDFLKLPCDTRENQYTYYVDQGSVDVYVCTKKDNVLDKKMYLCRVSQGQIIPPYYYIDRAHARWFFVLEPAADHTRLRRTDSTGSEELCSSFISGTPAASFFEAETVSGPERYSQALSEWYKEVKFFGTPAVPEKTDAARDHASQQTPEVPEAKPAASERKPIHLERNQEYITDRKVGSVGVTKGSAYIFVMRRYGSELQKPVCLGTAEVGEQIPVFCATDYSHTRWRFRLVPVGESVELIECAETVDEKEFLKKMGLQSFLTDPEKTEELLKTAVINWYNAEILKPIPGIEPEKEEEPIKMAPSYEESENALFKAVAYACEASRISCQSEDELKISCGCDEFTVQKIAEVSHFICRKVILEENWWKDDCGPIIGWIEGMPVSCVPGRGGKYKIYYGDKGCSETLTREIAMTISPDAYSIGRTLPGEKCSRKDIRNFCLKSIHGGDIATVGLLALAGALIGVLIPTLNQKIYDDYIPLGNYGQMIQLCVVIGSFMLGSMFLEMVKNLSEYHISSKMGCDIENAAIYRSFHLPEKFFRNQDSADLASRIQNMDSIVTAYTDTYISGGFTVVFSLAYLYKMFKYAPKLGWAAIAMLLLVSGLFFWLSLRAARYEKDIQTHNGEASARLYQYLNAIDKIRLAGAEGRAAHKYLTPVKDSELKQMKKNRLISFNSALNGVAVTVITMVFYYVMVKKNISISIGNFTAFNSAFGMLASTVLSFTNGLIQVYLTGPQLERVMPVFDTPTEYAAETAQGKHTVTKLDGKIELRDVSFRYGENSPMVLKNLNMTIEPGEYVGIVGKSGCGKSTLLKLLLGFEQPVSGSILFDNNNLGDMDKKSFRRNLGVVLQNGRLINGSIFENITVTCPKAGTKEVRKVLKAVGMEEDIKQMPMGIQTMLNESCSTISGGQQQRILIARAIVGEPNVLFLDEATSALDNLTQKTVCDSLDALKATRVVIAHRLSTIKNCDKIYVLDKGNVIESGSYDELMRSRGMFYEMAARQLVEGGNEE